LECDQSLVADDVYAGGFNPQESGTRELYHIEQSSISISGKGTPFFFPPKGNNSGKV